MKKYTTHYPPACLDLSAMWQRLASLVFASKYLRHNILLLVANVLAGVFAYLLHPFLARMMRIQEYGQVATFITLALVLATPAQVISTVAAKYASSFAMDGSHARLNDFIRRLTGLLLLAGIATTCIYIATSGYIASFFHFNTQEEVILFSFIFAVSFVFPLNQGAIQGLQLFGWYASITLLSAILRLVLSIAFVFLGFGINGAILGITLSALLTYLISILPLQGVLRESRIPVGSLRTLWSYSILTAAAATGMVALYSIDTILARHFLSAADAGLYAALATIGRTALFVTSSISIIMFPKVVTLRERGEPYTRVVVQAVLGTLALASLVEIAFCVAPSLLTRVMFGQAFLPIAGLLALYGIVMLLVALAQVLVMYFLAVGNRLFVLLVVVACFLQVTLIFWHHGGIAQIVNGVLLANIALVLALLVAWMAEHGNIRQRSGK